MNLYKYHNDPNTLAGDRLDTYTRMFWESYDGKEPYDVKYDGDITTITGNTEYSFYMAKEVLKDKFPEGEKAIAKSPFYSYWYAREILKDRFEEGEWILMTSEYKNNYLQFLQSKGIEI